MTNKIHTDAVRPASMVHSRRLPPDACHLQQMTRWPVGMDSTSQIRLMLLLPTMLLVTALPVVEPLRCDVTSHANLQAPWTPRRCHYTAHNGAVNDQGAPCALHNNGLPKGSLPTCFAVSFSVIKVTKSISSYILSWLGQRIGPVSGVTIIGGSNPPRPDIPVSPLPFLCVILFTISDKHRYPRSSYQNNAQFTR